MDIFEASLKNLERKSLAVLALPLVTLNGEVRHVNTAMGNALKGFCGYNYKQATVDRFLRELKYLGASQWLLGGSVLARAMVEGKVGFRDAVFVLLYRREYQASVVGSACAEE